MFGGTAIWLATRREAGSGVALPIASRPTASFSWFPTEVAVAVAGGLRLRDTAGGDLADAFRRSSDSGRSRPSPGLPGLGWS